MRRNQERAHRIAATAHADRCSCEKTRGRKLRKSQWWKNQLAQGHCYYCNKSFHPSELTMDHIIPIARGGRSRKKNVVPCCKECNSKKKCLLPVEWKEYLEMIQNRKRSTG